MVDPARRRAVVEYNHRGAKASHIAQVLERFGREIYRLPNLEFDFAPHISEEFIEAIERFGRIRLATARLVRPNPGWDEHYASFMGLATDSEARTIEVEVTASRGGSLSSARGLVAHVKRLARERFPSLKSARVEGYREGENQPATVSLQNHVEHQRVNVRKHESGHVDDEDIEEKMEAYLRDSEPR